MGGHRRCLAEDWPERRPCPIRADSDVGFTKAPPRRGRSINHDIILSLEFFGGRSFSSSGVVRSVLWGSFVLCLEAGVGWKMKGFPLLGFAHVSPRRPDYWSWPTRAPPRTRIPHWRLWTGLHDRWQVPHHGAFLSPRLRYSKELRPQPASLSGCKSPLPSTGFILSECVAPV